MAEQRVAATSTRVGRALLYSNSAGSGSFGKQLGACVQALHQQLGFSANSWHAAISTSSSSTLAVTAVQHQQGQALAAQPLAKIRSTGAQGLLYLRSIAARAVPPSLCVSLTPLHVQLPNTTLSSSAVPIRHFSSNSTPKRDDVPQKSAPSSTGLSIPTAASATNKPYDPVYNAANAVSVARLISGPIIAAWLLQGKIELATAALVLSGASDWLDGFLARRYNPSGSGSVVGSYLDPLADKVLVGCVAAALLAKGTMPMWLAGVVVGRDVALVAASFLHRFHTFGWRWPGREAFFKTADTAGAVGAAMQPLAAAAAAGQAGTGSGASTSTISSSSGLTAGNAASSDGSAAASGGEAGAAAGAGAPGVVKGMGLMKPLFVSKVNTVLQLAVVGSYLTQELAGVPPPEVVHALEYATAATTLSSGAMYAYLWHKGRIFS